MTARSAAVNVSRAPSPPSQGDVPWGKGGLGGWGPRCAEAPTRRGQGRPKDRVMEISLKTSTLFAVLLLVTGAAGAEEPQQPPPGSNLSWQSPPAPSADTGPRRVAFREEPRKPRPSASPHSGPLKGLRAVSLKEGEARVALGGSERVLRPGDAIGTDVVKSIEPGRMVLARTTPELGEALVIVTFDAQGRPRVRVFATRDPSSRVPPEVR